MGVCQVAVRHGRARGARPAARHRRCSSGGDGDSAASAGDSTPAAPEREGGSSGSGSEAGAADESRGPADVDIVGSGAQIDVVSDDRDVIYTATVSVAVDDVRGAAAQARAIAATAGGRLHDETSRGVGDAAESKLVLKVPTQRFHEVLDAVGALGEEKQRTVAAEDVTAEMVDLDARIASAAASVERTRALLAEAKTIGEIVSVEAELAMRETALEQLEGQRRVLEAQVALATITVDLSVRVPAAPPVTDADDGGLSGPLDALAAGGRSVLAVGNVVLVVFVGVLPWVPIAGAVAAGALWVRKRRTPSTRPDEPFSSFSRSAARRRVDSPSGHPGGDR